MICSHANFNPSSAKSELRSDSEFFSFFFLPSKSDQKSSGRRSCKEGGKSVVRGWKVMEKGRGGRGGGRGGGGGGGGDGKR